MPDIDRAIDSLLHRAEHRQLYDLATRSFGNGRKRPIKILGTRFGAAFERHPEKRQFRTQCLEPVRTRSSVDTKEPRERLSRDKVRSARIGRQHAFFDDSVGVVVVSLLDGLYFAVLIAHNLRFGRFKINRSAFFARRAESFKKLIKRLNIL